MNLNTKVFLILQSFSTNLKKKLLYFRMFFANGIFFLFIGFLAGNLFGSLLNIFYESIIWDGFITLFVILLAELISYLIYHSKRRIGFFAFNINNFANRSSVEKNTIFQQIIVFIIHCFEKCFFLIKNFFKTFFSIIQNYSFIFTSIFYTSKKIAKKFYWNKVFFIKSLNLFKIGILLGFFIDAFKVGS